MKRWLKGKLIDLPRSFRIWWGKVFIWMLGKHGTDEFNDDMELFNVLRKWLDDNK